MAFEEELRIEDFFDISALVKKDIKWLNSDMRIFLQGRFGESIFYDGKKKYYKD